MTVVLPNDRSLHAHLALLLHPNHTVGPFTIFLKAFRLSPTTDLDKLRVLATDDTRFTIAAGIAFLLMSVILYARYSQPLLVWAVSTTTASILAFNLIMTMLDDFLSQKTIIVIS